MNNFRGDVTDVSAKQEPLVFTPIQRVPVNEQCVNDVLGHSLFVTAQSIWLQFTYTMKRHYCG